MTLLFELSLQSKMFFCFASSLYSLWWSINCNGITIEKANLINSLNLQILLFFLNKKKIHVESQHLSDFHFRNPYGCHVLKTIKIMDKAYHLFFGN